MFFNNFEFFCTLKNILGLFVIEFFQKIEKILKIIFSIFLDIFQFLVP